MRALLLGAGGAIGSRVAAELARAPELERLQVAGRDEGGLQQLARALDPEGDRVQARRLDLADLDRAGDVFQKADVVASCAGPSYRTELAAAEAAVGAGTAYVSLCDEHRAFERVAALSSAAEAKGCTVVPGCGLSPGITNLLVSRAREELDEVEEIDISLARSAAESKGEASALHFLYELSQEAPLVSDHETAIERAGTAPKLVYFPDPVGWAETFRCGHPEAVTIPRLLDLRSMQFRMGLTERATMDTARAFVATGLAGRDRFRRAFLSLSGPVRPLLQWLPPRGPSWSAARVDVRGTAGGRSTTVTLGVVDRLLNLAAMPLVLATIALGTGRSSRPGVHPPESVFEHGPLLAGLYERGIRVARLEPANV